MEKITSVVQYSKEVLAQVNASVNISERIKEELVQDIVRYILDKDLINIEQKTICGDSVVKIKAECFLMKRENLLRIIKLIGDIERNAKEPLAMTVAEVVSGQEILSATKEIKDILRF